MRSYIGTCTICSSIGNRLWIAERWNDMQWIATNRDGAIERNGILGTHARNENWYYSRHANVFCSYTKRYDRLVHSHTFITSMRQIAPCACMECLVYMQCLLKCPLFFSTFYSFGTLLESRIPQASTRTRIPYTDARHRLSTACSKMAKGTIDGWSVVCGEREHEHGPCVDVSQRRKKAGKIGVFCCCCCLFVN